MILPPYLKPNDTIALICPAGFMPGEKAATCIETLQAWGYRVRTGSTLGGSSDNYFSGTDEQRLADLQWAIDDPDIKAILCGRGGYGLTRIIDHIDFSRFLQNPKWIIGYSDITVLHTHIWSNYKIATLHSPMAGAFNEDPANNPYIQSVRKALNGEPSDYTCPAHPFNRPGNITGRLIGGNLSLLAHLTGSSSEIKTKEKILFLEDIGEYRYNIDRMLYQLRRSGKLDHLAGLIIGGFTDIKDTTRPFGETTEEIIRDIVSKYDYPVCFKFPVSHEKENYPLKIGVKHDLKIGPEGVRLTETS